jgi:hypothetical protein
MPVMKYIYSLIHVKLYFNGACNNYDLNELLLLIIDSEMEGFILLKNNNKVLQKTIYEIVLFFKSQNLKISINYTINSIINHPLYIRISRLGNSVVLVFQVYGVILYGYSY